MKKNSSAPERKVITKKDPSKITPDEKIAIAARCLNGETPEKLSREVGVTPQIIESWVERVGEIMEGRPSSNLDIEEQIKQVSAEKELLLKKIAETNKVIEYNEAKIRAAKERPSFMAP